MKFAVSKVTATHPTTLESAPFWLPAALLLATGCLGGNGQGIDPELKAQRRQLSKETVETAGLPSRAERAAADESEAEADEAAPDMPAMDDQEAQTAEEQDDAPAPSNDDDPNAMEPAPPSEASLSDDSVRCGDGVVDPGELCDIGIEEGEPGACPMSEDECDNTDACYPEVYVVRSCWTHCEPVEPDAGCEG